MWPLMSTFSDTVGWAARARRMLGGRDAIRLLCHPAADREELLNIPYCTGHLLSNSIYTSSTPVLFSAMRLDLLPLLLPLLRGDSQRHVGP